MTEKQVETIEIPTVTLRDWFAGMALQGMLAHSRGNPPHGYRPTNPEDHWHTAITREAYEIADAMLTEQNRKRAP